MAKALMANSTLTALSMAQHKMCDHGANWLGLALEKNDTLTDLDLRKCVPTSVVCSGLNLFALLLVLSQQQDHDDRRGGAGESAAEPRRGLHDHARRQRAQGAAARRDRRGARRARRPQARALRDQQPAGSGVVRSCNVVLRADTALVCGSQQHTLRVAPQLHTTGTVNRKRASGRTFAAAAAAAQTAASS